MAPVVVLVGAPGCGKTTVGRALAATLGVEFRDTDTDIEQMAGKPIPEIFIDEGEAHFRTLERAAVAAALAAGTRRARPRRRRGAGRGDPGGPGRAPGGAPLGRACPTR